MVSLAISPKAKQKTTKVIHSEDPKPHKNSTKKEKDAIKTTSLG